MIRYEDRHIPELGRIASQAEAETKQAEFLQLLQTRLYGRMPEAPKKVTAILVSHEIPHDNKTFGGKVRPFRYALRFMADKCETGFEYELLVPNDDRVHPYFVNLCFHQTEGCNYLPTEEIIDRGYGIASICYTDVSADADIWDGIAQAYAMDRSKHDDWGKIGIWAFAASRIVDHLYTLSYVDKTRIAVIGHSRLGKTAVWAGANDKRFSLVISNESGCGGAAVNRGKLGETLSGMTYTYPYWFCPGMKDLRYLKNEELDFDSHYLLSLIAPRALLVGSDDDDEWVDGYSEFCACRAASPMWEAYHKTGFLCQAEEPKTGDVFHDGSIGYHLRKGTHYLSRTDWNLYMDYRDRHGV